MRSLGTLFIGLFVLFFISRVDFWPVVALVVLLVLGLSMLKQGSAVPVKSQPQIHGAGPVVTESYFKNYKPRPKALERKLKPKIKR